MGSLDLTTTTTKGLTKAEELELRINNAIHKLDLFVDTIIDADQQQQHQQRRLDAALAVVHPPPRSPDVEPSYSSKVKMAYVNQVMYFPFALVGYNHYLRDDVAMTLMYVFTFGFFGLGAIADFFLIPFQNTITPSRVWMLIRKVYSFAFVLLMMLSHIYYAPIAPLHSRVSCLLVSLFIANEIGFFTMLITSSIYLYGKETSVTSASNLNLPGISPTFILSLMLISFWMMDFRIQDMPFRRVILPILMSTSLAYNMYLLVFTRVFPTLAEKVSLISYKLIAYQVANIFGI